MTDDVITLTNLDDFEKNGPFRWRSKTWSFNKPIRPARSPPSRESSVKDICNDLLRSSNDFLDKLGNGNGYRYEELSDIEEGVQSVIRISDADTAKELSLRKKSDLSKLCGYQSYHHMIEKAISCSPDKMMTLNQIYSWIESNVPYFKSLSDAGKGKSWKNSIRHNLSLHKQFYRVLRDDTRSCYWACDMNRIHKDGPRISRSKKLSSSPYSPPAVCEQQYSPPGFRPRAKSDTTMVKPMKKHEPLCKDSKENLVKKPYNSLSSRFEAIEKKKNGLSLENLDFDRVTLMEHTSNFPPEDPFFKGNYGNPYEEFTYGSANHSMSNSPEYSSNEKYQILELDTNAIIAHEKHLYEQPS